MTVRQLIVMLQDCNDDAIVILLPLIRSMEASWVVEDEDRGEVEIA